MKKEKNEVAKEHPFMITNKEIKKAFPTLHTNVKEEHINSWNTFKKNKPDKNTLIATYLIKSYRILFEYRDNSVIFTPYNKNGKFIKGDIEIWLESPTSAEVRRLFQISTVHMHPNPMGDYFSSPEFLRSWQHRFVGVSGDTIKVYFESKKEFVPKNSLLMIKAKEMEIV